MTPVESINDMPRLRTRSSRYGTENLVEPKEVRDYIMILTEHNRAPGVFNYDYPQTFFSTFPEIEYESYVTIGGKGQRRVHTNEDCDLPVK